MTDVIDLVRKAEEDSKKDLLIFNPLSDDVTCQYDGVQYFIPSKENKKFPTPIALHVGNYLVNLYMNTKDEKTYSIEQAKKLVFND